MIETAAQAGKRMQILGPQMRMMWVNALGESNQFKLMKTPEEWKRSKNSEWKKKQQKWTKTKRGKKEWTINEHCTHAYDFDAEQRQWPSNLELYSLRQKVKA